MAAQGLKFTLFVVLLSLSLTSLAVLRVKGLDGLKFIRSQDLSIQTDVCHGHYYLCRFRDALTKSNWYNGHIQLHSHLHDFSGITQFKTKFFKNESLVELSSSFWDPRMKKMKRQLRTELVRIYMQKEFPWNWYKQNILFEDLNKTESVKLCSLQSTDFLKYATKPKGFKSSGWPMNALFEVHEAKLSKLPIAIPYSDIYTTVTTPHTTASCITESYVDLDDRSQYSISCPILEDNFTIEMNSSIRTGSVYILRRHECNNLDKHIRVIKTYSPADLDTSPVLNKTLTSDLPICPSSMVQHVPGYWLKKGEIWHWSNYKCYFPYDSFDPQLHNCLSKTKLIICGDSHMGYKHQAMRSHFKSDMFGISVALASEFLYKLRKQQAMLLNATQPTVVIMNCGQHSFVALEPLSYISDMMEIIKLISVIKESTVMVKFIWIDTTSVSYTRPNHLRFGENNIIAAMNDIVNWHMERTGVSVIRAYDISVPMQHASRDGFHYHSLLGKDAMSDTTVVNVGGAITSVLLNTICSRV